ncbi:MAG: hypothetical protein N2654_01555 [Deltaproteobacteria bacterium]|nr:hypothetical protein [Deltaproteobacteria bacterium]
MKRSVTLYIHNLTHERAEIYFVTISASRRNTFYVIAKSVFQGLAKTRYMFSISRHTIPCLILSED